MTIVTSRRSLFIALAAAGFALASLTRPMAPAFAQAYPTRTVAIVVPYVPGGFPDTFSRILAQKLSEWMGQPFIVENRPGASGITAADYVAKAAPDGHTVMMADRQQISISPSINKNLPYDPVKSFAPVSFLGGSQQFLFVSAAGPVSTFKDMVKLVKANPGKYNYGTPGIASIHHLLMEQIKSETGMDMVHVPYKGGGQSFRRWWPER